MTTNNPNTPIAPNVVQAPSVDPAAESHATTVAGSNPNPARAGMRASQELPVSETPPAVPGNYNELTFRDRLKLAIASHIRWLKEQAALPANSGPSLNPHGAQNPNHFTNLITIYEGDAEYLSSAEELYI